MNKKNYKVNSLVLRKSDNAYDYRYVNVAFRKITALFFWLMFV